MQQMNKWSPGAGRDAFHRVPTIRGLIAIAVFVLALSDGRGASFVQNETDRARIETALPAKAIVQPLKPRKLLIFTRNVGYGGHPSIAYANEAFSLMGRKTGAFETVVSDDPEVFRTATLSNFDAVFFNNTVGNCFTNAELRRNLVEFVLCGGGLLGVHGTTVAFMNWPGAVEDWPEFGYLIAARGANHKDSDERVWLKLDDPDHPLVQTFEGRGFEYADEFFRPQGTYSRERVRVLLSLDTSKTDPNKGQPRGNTFRSDNDYAAAWIRSYGRGRVFYSTIAHNPYVFYDAKMLRFYLAALQFALGDLPAATTPSARLTPSIRAQEKLGWRLAFEGGPTLSSAASRASSSGWPYLAVSMGMATADGASSRLTPELPDADLEQVRLDLEKAAVRLLTMTVPLGPENATSADRLFEFGRKLGIELFVFDQAPPDVALLDQAATTAGIRVALTASDPRTALSLLRSCQNRSRMVGVLLDLSRQPQSWRQPAPLLRESAGRLFALRLPPGQVQHGVLENILDGIAHQGERPIFLAGAGAEGTEPSAVAVFKSASLKLAVQRQPDAATVVPINRPRF